MTDEKQRIYHRAKVYRHRRKRKVCRKRQQRFVHLDRLCYVCSPFVKGLIAKDYVQETMVEKIVFVPMYFSFKKDFENSLTFFKKSFLLICLEEVRM